MRYRAWQVKFVMRLADVIAIVLLIISFGDEFWAYVLRPAWTLVLSVAALGHWALVGLALGYLCAAAFWPSCLSSRPWEVLR